MSEGDKMARLCFECHTADNNNPDPLIPKLIGQDVDYLVNQTLDYKSGRRISTLMADVLENVKTKDIRAISEYFASRPAMTGTKKETELGKKGKDVYLSRNCHFCHGLDADPATAYIDGAPLIKGQNKEYMYKTMKDMQTGKRPVDIFNLMQIVLLKLTDDEIEALSEYISSL
ncbi:MAG: c-type cytochrome [Gammaproteobacteria bacterium]|nr:c-type cytochrome [Gammaproteobacteria bacterium]MDH5592931.1 c-type cytochrome [Gammaproteobacteria bacterium]